MTPTPNKTNEENRTPTKWTIIVSPGSCWATGPLTGDDYEDLVVCPGCRAIKVIDEAIQLLTTDSSKSPAKCGGCEDCDRLQAHLESVLVWAEDAIAFKRKWLQDRWKIMRETRDKNWKPGTRFELQVGAYTENTIQREEEEFQKWKSPVRDANKLLDLILKYPTSPSNTTDSAMNPLVAQASTPQTPSEIELRAMYVLGKHHKWQLGQTEPDKHGIILAEAYQESELCEETIDALKMPLSALEPPMWLVRMLLRCVSCHHIQHHGFGPLFDAAMKLTKQAPLTSQHQGENPTNTGANNV